MKESRFVIAEKNSNNEYYVIVRSKNQSHYILSNFNKSLGDFENVYKWDLVWGQEYPIHAVVEWAFAVGLDFDVIH